MRYPIIQPTVAGLGGFLFWLLAMFACGLDTLGYDPNADTGGEPVDRGEPVDFVVYPSSDEDHVFLYYGHGGVELRPKGKLRDAWESEGWLVRQGSELPADLKSFRMYLFVATGANSTAPAPDAFQNDEVEALSQALARGTRLVFLQESAQCGSDNVTGLLDEWDSPIAFDQALPGDASPQSFVAVAPGAQPMADVSSVSLKQPCTLTVGGSWLVRTDDAQALPLAASFRPENAGDVVLIGATDFLKDGTIDLDNNLIFAQNLAKVVP